MQAHKHDALLKKIERLQEAVNLAYRYLILEDPNVGTQEISNELIHQKQLDDQEYAIQNNLGHVGLACTYQGQAAVILNVLKRTYWIRLEETGEIIKRVNFKEVSFD